MECRPLHPDTKGLADYYDCLSKKFLDKFVGREEITAILEGLVLYVSEVNPGRWLALASEDQTMTKKGRGGNLDTTYNWLRVAKKSNNPVLKSLSSAKQHQFAVKMGRKMAQIYGIKRVDTNASQIAAVICKFLVTLYKLTGGRSRIPGEIVNFSTIWDINDSICALNTNGQFTLPFNALKIPRATFPDAIPYPEAHMVYSDQHRAPTSKFFKNYNSLVHIL